MEAADPTPLIVHATQLALCGPGSLLAPAEPLQRIRRGSYLSAQRWEALYAGERHAALVHATAAKMSRPLPTFSFHAAAALWGLPIIGNWPSTVDVTLSCNAAGSSAIVRRHRVREVPRAELIAGLPVTSVARTVIDLARTTSLISAVVTADAALRSGGCSHSDLLTEAQAVADRASGRRQALRVVALADERSGSVGESLSRAQMFQLGFPQPDLQVPLADEGRVFGYADFGWADLIGEFDGRVKYRADGFAAAGAEDAVWREKLREDMIRRTHRVVRWIWEDCLDAVRLRRILLRAGLEPVPGRPWHDHRDGARVR